MRTHRSIIAVVLISGLASGTARAAPHYSAPLSEATRAQARNELAERARTDRLPAGAADRLLAATVVATSNDTGCPGVDVDVVNATDHTVWNVELEIKQKLGATEHVDLIRLPYLAAATVAHARVACINDHRSVYSSQAGGIQLGYVARGARTLGEALAGMREAKADYELGQDHVGPRTAVADGGRPPSGDDPTLLAAALRFEDAAVARELVLGIASTGIGLDELAAEIARKSGGPIADEAGRGLPRAPREARAGLARVLLASTAAFDRKAQLLPMIDGPLCHGKRTDAVQLWIQARNERDLPHAEMRAHVLASCKPAAGDGPALAWVLDRAPARASEVLDAVDPALFDRAIASWRAHTEDGAPGLAAYLRDSTDPARFDRAAAAAPPAELVRVIAEVVKAPAGPAIDRKAAWVTAALDQISLREAAVRALTQELVEAKIPDGPMHDAVRAARQKVPAAASAVIAEYAGSHSPVFDVAKLDASVDAGEVLAFSTAKLVSCGASLDALRACAKLIAAYQGGALARVAPGAVRGEFASTVRQLTHSAAEPGLLTSVAAELHAAGLPTAFITEDACHEAKEHDDPEAGLAVVEAIDPGAPCIAQVRDDVVRRRHKDFWLAVFALVGLVVPFPAGGAILRRRYRKLQRDLPAAAPDPTRHGDTLADRLGQRGLGPGLRAGVAVAARELADTAAGQAAATIDTAVLDAAAATVGRAVRSGGAASLLVRRASDAVYVVALPVLHPRPQIAERYLGAPWSEHIASIQRAAGRSVLALVVLCGPEAKEAQLLAGFCPAPDDPRPASDPEALLDARAARERGANRFRHVMTLSATPSHEA